MIVLKFGGTSVGNPENLKRVKQTLSSQKQPFVIVVSAFSGVTNLLEQLANSALQGDFRSTLDELRSRNEHMVSALLSSDSQIAIIPFLENELSNLETICRGISTLQELSDKTMARVFSFGEMVSSTVIHAYLIQEGLTIHHLDSSELMIANGAPLAAMVDYRSTDKNFQDSINSQENYICGGFIAKNSEGERVVLGRGGSDLTASVIAQAINAERLEIWRS